MSLTLTQRAERAYFRAHPTADIPAGSKSGEEEHGDREYVALRNGARTLAVFRVKPDGALRRLKRWPKALDW